MKASVYIGCSVDGFIATPTGGLDFLEVPSPSSSNNSSRNGQEEEKTASATSTKTGNTVDNDTDKDAVNAVGEEKEGKAVENITVEDSDFGFAAFLASIDVIVMGRKSFDKVMSFGSDQWPYGKTRVLVWSRSRTHHLRTDTKEETDKNRVPETVSYTNLGRPQEILSKLQTEGHEHAYIDGGTTIQNFLAEGLIDQLCITRVPVLLGAGIPLFGNNNVFNQQPLEHQKTKVHTNGMVTTTYRVVREQPQHNCR